MKVSERYGGEVNFISVQLRSETRRGAAPQLNYGMILTTVHPLIIEWLAHMVGLSGGQPNHRLSEE